MSCPSCTWPLREAPKRASASPQPTWPRTGKRASGRAASSLSRSATRPAAWKVGARAISAATVYARACIDGRGAYRWPMSRLHQLRVFCAEDGSGGNPLGVFLEGAEVPRNRRQAVAADLGFPETVFVDDADRGAIRIFTPAEELDFAGHPSVGAAWLLEDLRT